MKFDIPDPKKYRISSCGKYIIEKIPMKDGSNFYCVWEYKMVLSGCKSSDEAVQAIKSREASHLLEEAELFGSFSRSVSEQYEQKANRCASE